MSEPANSPGVNEPGVATPIGDEPGTITARVVPPSAIPPGTPRFYANFAQATVAVHDVTIRFGWYATPTLGPETSTADQPIDVEVETVAVMTLPIGIVPNLVEVLQGQVASRVVTDGESLENSNDANETA